MDYFIKDQNLTEDNLKDDLFKDSMCLAIHNKLLRKVAVKEMDKIIHKTIINDDIPSYHAEKVERYEFVTALLRQASHNLDRDFIKPEVVKKLYAEGKTLADGLQSAFFKKGRQWQKDYGFGKKHKENVLMPCSIRDHYKNFKINIITPGVKGEDEEAEAALHDTRYEELLNNYDEELNNLSLRIFEEKYVLRMVDVSYK